ncbi:hypothetical protein Tco_0111544 [Tanacetum coccineum]
MDVYHVGFRLGDVWSDTCRASFTLLGMIICYIVIESRFHELSATCLAWISVQDSSEESVGTSTARVILFRMIPTVIPTTVPIVDPPVVHDDTPLIPTKTLTISSVFPTLLHTSPFLYTDSSDSDTSERPPSHDSYKILPAPPGLPRRPTILVLPGQPIPFGRPYRTQPNGVCKMLTTRKRVRALPSGRLASSYLLDHSSSDYFLSDDSSSDFSSDSSSDYSSDSSSGHSLPDSSVDTPTTIFTGLSRKRFKSPAVSVPLATPVPGALSPVRADLLPSHKRIRGSISATDQDDITEESYEAYTEPDIDSDVQADINNDTVAAEAATARETDIGVEVDIGSDREDEAKLEDRGTIEIEVHRVTEHVVSDDVYESASDDMLESADERGLDALVQELHDHLVEILVRRNRVIESVQRD